jgi:hypothetical protein
MEKEQIIALMKEKGISSCETGLLGFVLGHLADHGLSREESLDVVTFLVDGIYRMKNDPALLAATEQIGQVAMRASGG